MILLFKCFFFFFNDTATTEIYTLSLHDALPICPFKLDDKRKEFVYNRKILELSPTEYELLKFLVMNNGIVIDRKSTRLNSSHVEISYAVFCLKKKKNK